MLTRLDGTPNQVATMTGAVGRIVGHGARAPPPSWSAELAELLAADFAAAHERACRRDEGLAQRLLAMLMADWRAFGEGEGVVVDASDGEATTGSRS